MSNMQYNFNREFEVLIVDDISENLQVLSSILDFAELDISIATNGQQALESVKYNPPDLILLDISMPEMDGYEVCQILKNDDKTKDIPIIFLTAKVDKESIVKGFQVGGQDYLTKPFNSDELLVRVKTHLDLRSKTKQLEYLNEKLEQKVVERTAQLETAHKQLQNLEKAKSDFLTIISHEIRTPLNGVLGFANLLEVSSESKENIEKIEILKESVDRLVSFSETALLITQLRAEKYKMNFSKIPINDIYIASLSEVGKKLKEKNIEISENIQYSNISLLCDFEMIKNCFVNILDNAIKYSVVNDEIIINVVVDGDTIICEFIDNGRGFSEEALSKLFDFFAADQLEFHSEGLGLDLAAVKLIIEAHSGKVIITNRDQGGASVKLFFMQYN